MAPKTFTAKETGTGKLHTVEVVVPTIAKSTAEGPFWLNDQKKFFFSDLYLGDLYQHDAVTGKLDSIHFDTFLTFCIPRKNGGYVAGLGQKIIQFEWNDHQNYKVLAELDKGLPTRLNDAKCDKNGILWAATMGLEKRPAIPAMECGSIYSVDTNNKLHHWDSKFHIANSVAWNKEYTTMYLTESIGGILYAYDYDAAKGSVSNRRVVSYLPHTENGILDRITTDTDGNVWAAFYRSGKVARIDPKTGDITFEIILECPTLTCLIWGGENYDELFVTSSSYEQDMSVNVHAGGIFKIKGLPGKGFAPNFFNGKN